MFWYTRPAPPPKRPENGHRGLVEKFDITEGWNDWCFSPPHAYLGGDVYPIEIMRKEWDKPSVIFAKDMRPEMNVAGLYWRATGIYKHFMSEVRPGIQQMNRCGLGGGSFLSGLLGNTGSQGAANSYGLDRNSWKT